MISISLCMIVRDESETLDRCLSSIRHLVDEIIVVDTGSTDNTKEIALKYNAFIYNLIWKNNFADARNYSFKKATKEFILWLDADDYIDKKSQQKLLHLKQNVDANTNVIWMPHWLKTDNLNRVMISTNRERLVRSTCNFQWEGAIHETLHTYGSSIQSDIIITHGKIKPRTDRNLNIFRQLEQKGFSFSFRDLFNYASELTDSGYYEEAINYYNLCLKTGNDNNALSKIKVSACIKKSYCYYQLHENEKRIEALQKALDYKIPSAFLYCSVGEVCIEENNFMEGIYWLLLATKSTNDLGFAKDYKLNTWYPRLQLCVCLDKLGYKKLAYEQNEIAFKYAPNHPSILQNRTYLLKYLDSSQYPEVLPHTFIPIFVKSSKISSMFKQMNFFIPSS